MKTKNDIFRLTLGLIFFVSLFVSNLSCNRTINVKHTLNHIRADTLNLQLKNIEIQIDSMKSGITRDFLREVLPIRDSIQVDFDGYFFNTPVILIHNNLNIYQDTLETDESLGWSSYVKFKRSKKENNFELRIEGIRYKFKENNNYNFIHISDIKNKDLEIIYTNKEYVYE